LNPTILSEKLHRYRDCFPGPHLDMVLASMLAGNTAGELWDITQDDGSLLLLLWDKANNVLYLAGTRRTPPSLASLDAILTTQLRPGALATGRRRFKVHALSPALEGTLPALFPDTGLQESRILFFADDSSRELPAASPSVPDVTISPITAALLSSGSHAHADDVRGEIRAMWPSEGRFHEHGFGSVATKDGEIICWCTAEYVSPAHCGIGIETFPPFERRGVATATAAHFVRQARQRGITAYWECDSANQGSIRVAEKVGFARQSEEVYWVGLFPSR
jgi:GNAT superfamily N-acetyltransferase